MGVYIEIAQFAWNVLFGVGTLVALAWTWTLRRSAADAKSLAAIESKLSEQDQEIQSAVGELDTRIGRIEERVSHMPTGKEMTEIREALAKIGAEVAQAKGELHSIVRSVDRISGYLMERER